MEWRLGRDDAGLRLAPASRRRMGSGAFNWTELLYGSLGNVKAFVLYFPSRFDLPVDARARDALRAFGLNTGEATSVNFWSPQDPEFDRALALFNVKKPPALVILPGLALERICPLGPTKAELYAITVSDQEILGDPERLAGAVNAAHKVILSADPREIRRYLREQSADALLSLIRNAIGKLAEHLLRLKPKLVLPDGTSIQLGG